MYLSEARTSGKYRNNLGELLTNTKETFYFTQRTTARGSKHVYTYIKARVYIHVYNYDNFLFQYNLLYLVKHISEAQRTFKHNISDRFIRKIEHVKSRRGAARADRYCLDTCRKTKLQVNILCLYKS